MNILPETKTKNFRNKTLKMSQSVLLNKEGKRKLLKSKLFLRSKLK